MIYRPIAIAALSLSALAAHAQATDAPNAADSGLTREAVIAELVAWRQAPTLRDGEWYNVPAPLSISQTGAAVAAQPATPNAVATTKADTPLQ